MNSIKKLLLPKWLEVKRIVNRQFSLKTRVLVVGGGLVILCLGFVIWLVRGISGPGGASQSIMISKGESRLSVAKRLDEAKLISSWPQFVVLSIMRGAVIRAGTFVIDPNLSTIHTLKTISERKRAEQVITIPEGWRKEQIADYLVDKGINKEEFLTLTKEKEGQLFPDTYYIDLSPKAEDVVTRLVNNYNLKTKDLQLTTDQLILASIVEREAKRDDDRPLIAGIFLNRLNKGMKLEADPTVQYARDTNLTLAGQSPKEWWLPITRNDYDNVISNYNLYLHSGLTPGPICNPGLKSIEAVLKPTSTKALYFFHTSDGRTITSQTLDEHNANKLRFLRKQ